MFVDYLSCAKHCRYKDGQDIISDPKVFTVSVLGRNMIHNENRIDVIKEVFQGAVKTCGGGPHFSWRGRGKVSLRR